jgi:amino acid transporter
MYIFFGNISGNGIAFGMYVMIAAGKNPYDPDEGYHRGAVYGLAVGAMTLCAFLHIFSRRGGLLASNFFGLYKILLLVLLIVFGWVYAGGKFLHGNSLASGPTTQPSPKGNFDKPFEGRTHDFASVVNSVLTSLFGYSGFEQPFYVLSEVKNPRQKFPKTILGAVFTTMVLYILTDISYMLVIPLDYINDPKNQGLDVAGMMLQILFDKSGTFDPNLFPPARRIAAALIALSILGNILVMTFTAARVKQEIAKEGIIPYSLFFASGYTTPWARLTNGRRRRQEANTIRIKNIDIDNPLERSPIPALVLHWFTSLFLLAISAWAAKPKTAYTLLLTLYSYTTMCVIGWLVSAGLLYLKIDSWVRGTNGRNWANKAQWTPYLDPLPNIIFFLSTGFIAIGALVPVKSQDSPFSPSKLGYPTWAVALVSLTSLLWGVVWWGLLRFHERNRKRRLIVTRTPYLDKNDDGNYIQKVELITHDWEPHGSASRFENYQLS